MLIFERLDVYQVAIEFRRALKNEVLPHCSADLRDQLERASSSIVLNIAEGAGRWQAKKRFFEIARGSACESSGRDGDPEGRWHSREHR
jgi:four helix bundle protein